METTAVSMMEHYKSELLVYEHQMFLSIYLFIFIYLNSFFLSRSVPTSYSPVTLFAQKKPVYKDNCSILGIIKSITILKFYTADSIPWEQIFPLTCIPIKSHFNIIKTVMLYTSYMYHLVISVFWKAQ